MLAVDFSDHFCLTVADLQHLPVMPLPLIFCLFFSTERPLHHSEKILEQVLEWSNLDCPSSAFLVIKKFSEAKRVTDGKGGLQYEDDGTKSLKMKCFKQYVFTVCCTGSMLLFIVVLLWVFHDIFTC